jgi:hypothetical protein
LGGGVENLLDYSFMVYRTVFNRSSADDGNRVQFVAPGAVANHQNAASSNDFNNNIYITFGFYANAIQQASLYLVLTSSLLVSKSPISSLYEDFFALPFGVPQVAMCDEVKPKSSYSV